MTWATFLAWLDPFIWGFVIGLFAGPVWHIGEKIWHEAKQARKDWRN